jgi:hypothetical protein
MTVGQLLLRLQAFPQNAPVCIHLPSELNILADVEHVRYAPEEAQVVIE